MLTITPSMSLASAAWATVCRHNAVLSVISQGISQQRRGKGQSTFETIVAF